MKLKQYSLKSGDRTETCWLEDGRCKIGDSVTLKDSDEPDRLWEVVESFSTIESKEIKRGWNNNI